MREQEIVPILQFQIEVVGVEIPPHGLGDTLELELVVEPFQGGRRKTGGHHLVINDADDVPALEIALAQFGGEQGVGRPRFAMGLVEGLLHSDIAQDATLQRLDAGHVVGNDGAAVVGDYVESIDSELVEQGARFHRHGRGLVVEVEPLVALAVALAVERDDIVIAG